MATTAQRLIINVETGTLVPAFESVVGTTSPRYTLGDTTPVELYLVKTTGSTGTTSQVPFPAGATVRLAVGVVNQQPTSGTWALTFGADTATGLAFNATASALETALNALPSITAAGGVTVAKVGNQYQITFTNVGARADFTGGSLSLVPASQVGIQTLQQGDASTREVVLVALAVSPIAQTSTFTDVAAPSGSYGPNNFSLTGGVRGGGFKLQLQYTQGTSTRTVWTNTISPFASFSDISQAIFSALTNDGWGSVTGNLTTNAWGLQVSGVDYLSWRVDFTAPVFSTPITVVAPTVVGINTTGITALAGKVGELSLATVEAIAYLNTQESKTAKVEVEVEAAGDVQTLIQTNCELAGQVIVSGAFAPLTADVPLGESVANNRFIRRDADQTLDPTSTNQIWENLTGVTTPTGVDLVGALTNAVTPSAANPLVTLSQVQTFDQPLNTTDAPTFAGLTVDDGANTGVFTQGNRLELTSVSGLDGGVYVNGASVAFSLTNGTDTVTVDLAGVTFADATQQTTAFIPADYLSKAGNLAGLASVSTARTNLGLGTMATAAAADYLAKANNLSDLPSASTARTNLGLGTMALAASGDYLAKADNLAGLASVATARTNLGLGTMALETATDYLTKADNLASLADAASSRTNLGLGDSDSPTFANVTLGLAGVITFGDATTQESAPTYSAGTGQSGGSGSTIHNGNYPDEVQIVIGGVTYAMPARIV